MKKTIKISILLISLVVGVVQFVASTNSVLVSIGTALLCVVCLLVLLKRSGIIASIIAASVVFVPMASLVFKTEITDTYKAHLSQEEAFFLELVDAKKESLGMNLDDLDNQMRSCLFNSSSSAIKGQATVWELIEERIVIYIYENIHIKNAYAEAMSLGLIDKAQTFIQVVKQKPLHSVIIYLIALLIVLVSFSKKKSSNKLIENVVMEPAEDFIFDSILLSAEDVDDEEVKESLESDKDLAPIPIIEEEPYIMPTDVSAFEGVDQLIGLNNIKRSLVEQLRHLEIAKLRKENELSGRVGLEHAVFLGNPGVGKTTVAKTLGKIYKELGLLSKGDVIEVNRGKLVGQYIGQTAIQTNKLIDSARGSVFFIDEAYGLAKKGDTKDFGMEAVVTILDRMENDKSLNTLFVIAGYEKEMSDFIDTNPGLKSRFKRYYRFQDYKPKELYRIFLHFCDTNDYCLANDAVSVLQDYLKDLYIKRDSNFGNARDIRNLFEMIVSTQANRLYEEKVVNVDKVSLMTIKKVDVEKGIKKSEN